MSHLVEFRTDAPWIRAEKSWLKAKETSEKAALALEKARFRLMQLADGASVSGNAVSVTRYFRAGNIQYGAIPELQSVDLDSYRRTGSWEMRISRT